VAYAFYAGQVHEQGSGLGQARPAQEIKPRWWSNVSFAGEKLGGFVSRGFRFSVFRPVHVKAAAYSGAGAGGEIANCEVQIADCSGAGCGLRTWIRGTGSLSWLDYFTSAQGF
jgi:hypothetical protein